MQTQTTSYPRAIAQQMIVYLRGKQSVKNDNLVNFALFVFNRLQWILIGIFSQFDLLKNPLTVTRRFLPFQLPVFVMMNNPYKSSCNIEVDLAEGNDILINVSYEQLNLITAYKQKYERYPDIDIYFDLFIHLFHKVLLKNYTSDTLSDYSFVPEVVIVT